MSNFFNRTNKYVGQTNTNGEHYDSNNCYVGRMDPSTGYIYDANNNYIGRKTDD